jgi:hypothetical protein
MDIKKLGLIASFLIVCAPVQACPPEQPPEQRLQAAMQAKKDLALVEVEADTQQQPGAAFAILKVIQGWGAPKRRHLTYPRQEADCPPPGKLDKGGRYLVVLEFYKVADIFEYSSVRKPLKSLGEPDYQYNRKGELKRKDAE